LDNAAYSGVPARRSAVIDARRVSNRTLAGGVPRLADRFYHHWRHWMILRRHDRTGDHLMRATHMTGTTAPLRRSRSNRMVAGIVAGLARYLGIDVSFARVLYVLISIFSAAFPGVLVYLIFWILVPQEEHEEQLRISAV
jgi:phage shock protein C